MAGTGFNPTATPSGEFSPLVDLMRDALMDSGETNPDLLIARENERLINAANRVINDINAHPYFYDIMRAAFDDITGCAMTVASALLTLPSSTTTVLYDYAPVKVAGAGSGGGDLYSFVLKRSETELRLADEADTTVSNATVSSPYRSRLRLYVSNTDIRAVDDQTMIEGIKSYYMMHDHDSVQDKVMMTQAYFGRLNTWLANLQGLGGDMFVEPRDESAF